MCKFRHHEIQARFGRRLPSTSHPMFTVGPCTVSFLDRGFLYTSPLLQFALGAATPYLPVFRGIHTTMKQALSTLPPRVWTLSIPRLSVEETVVGRPDIIQCHIPKEFVFSEEDKDDPLDIVLQDGCGMCGSALWVTLVTSRHTVVRDGGDQVRRAPSRRPLVYRERVPHVYSLPSPLSKPGYKK